VEFLRAEERQLVQITHGSDQSAAMVDLRKLLAGQAPNKVTLQAGDSPVIPRQRNGVAILGAVIRPGIEEYAPGRPVTYYIALAGGYTSRADRGDATVLRPGGGRLSARDAAALKPSDQVDIHIGRPAQCGSGSRRSTRWWA
jgi:hypothetical protein